MLCCIFKDCGSYHDFRIRVLLLTVFEFGRLMGTLPEFRKSSKYLSQDTITYHQRFSFLYFAVYVMLAELFDNNVFNIWSDSLHPGQG
jgi:hypothetical protein